MPGVKGMKGSGGPRAGAGRKPNSCQICIHWTVDTSEQSTAANDPPNWWGSCSQLGIQTEQDFLCKKFFKTHLCQYQCTRNLVSDFKGGTVVFTRDKLYQGVVSATPGGEWAMKFTNDLNEPHLITHETLYEYFKKK